jgi:hypothetical protein
MTNADKKARERQDRFAAIADNDPDEFAFQEEILAEELHALLCRYNHTDQCAWDYEPGWDQYTHQTYVNLASQLIGCEGGDVLAVLHVVRNLRELWTG